MHRLTLLLLVLLPLAACQRQDAPTGSATAAGNGATYQNPILAGFYPDPALIKAEGKFYMTHSTFSYFPGLPIFESSDLVNWKQIGNALDRPEQLDTDGEPITRGLFAPGINYHDGLFYVICTRIDRGGNFIVTAEDPAGPWSDPVYLPEVVGIDPSLYFEGDSTYVVYNTDPPNNESLYSGHRTIRMYALDRDELKVTGPQTLLVNGGTDLAAEPVWIEAPHIYKIDDWYYLMCAEGGTAYNHSEVVFRSKAVRGPYEPWDKNPILTQRTLDPARPNPVTTAGHADMVQTDDGNWWAVFLACRPYAGNYFNIGRETFLTPVKWEDGWPVINPDHEEIQYEYPTPMGVSIDTTLFPLNGNFTFTDEFDASELGLHYLFMRTPREPWYRLGDGKLTLDLRAPTANERKVTSFVGHRQQHHRGEVSTVVDVAPAADNEKAGLLAFQNESHYYFLARSVADGQPVVQLLRSTESGTEELASAPVEEGALRLKITFDGADYGFHYAADGDGGYTTLESGVDGKFLSTEEAGGFVGTLLGMYATSSGSDSDTRAAFESLTYTGDDAVLSKR